MRIYQDCRYFRGSVPCEPHKEYKVHCDGCKYYDSVNGVRLAILEFNRKSTLLADSCAYARLQERNSNIASLTPFSLNPTHITWLTQKESIPLFQNNDLVDVVIDYSAESFLWIQFEHYDLMINPDASPKSAMLAEAARGDRKLGFGYHKKGYVYPFNQEAQRWFEMGLFDDIKKANTLTYQQIILDMIGLTPSGCEIILQLNDDEKRFSKGFADKKGINLNELRIGLNAGSGGRWEFKKWTVEGFSRLIEMIHKNLSEAKILLYGGPEERERNNDLSNRYRGVVIDTACENSLREFISLLDLCDLLVTGDTMALHMAVALKKKVVALFGPTSSAEIELYGRGVNIAPEMDCLCCYRPRCEVRPTCMERIAPERVLAAIRDLLP